MKPCKCSPGPEANQAKYAKPQYLLAVSIDEKTQEVYPSVASACDDICLCQRDPFNGAPRLSFSEPFSSSPR